MMLCRSRGTLLAVLCSLALIVVTGGNRSVLAETGRNFSIEPAQASAVSDGPASYFSQIVNAGASFSDEALVTNAGSISTLLTLYAADGVTAVNGGTSFADRQTARLGAGSWVRLTASSVELQPGEKKRVPFTVAVPAGTPPGEYVAGLIAEAPPEAESAASDRQFGVSIVRRVGTAIVITVPGGVGPEIAISSCAMTGQDGTLSAFQLNVSGAGQLLAQGDGILTIRDDAGALLFEQRFDVDTIIPGTETTLNVFAPVQLEDGRYNIDAVISGYHIYSDTVGTPSSCPPTAIEVRDGQPVSAATTEDEPESGSSIVHVISGRPLGGGGLSVGGGAVVLALVPLGAGGVLGLFIIAIRRRRKDDKEAATEELVTQAPARAADAAPWPAGSRPAATELPASMVPTIEASLALAPAPIATTEPQTVAPLPPQTPQYPVPPAPVQQYAVPPAPVQYAVPPAPVPVPGAETPQVPPATEPPPRPPLVHE